MTRQINEVIFDYEKDTYEYLLWRDIKGNCSKINTLVVIDTGNNKENARTLKQLKDNY